MRKLDEYLVTIDTIYPDAYQRESVFFVARDLLAPAAMSVRRGRIGGVFDRLENWFARRKGRQALLDMSHEQLRDIGISRVDAKREAARSRFL
ncbi:Uncharacterized conserved protein YjiS, DUF1127 family [Rhizobium sp. NFR07]|uniref:DUF1127 domain-containing protein n=1 Tax=Rhizobium sp. NFR07 TaxID=1566262 RepID=UPI0008ECF189|nr:DUF1127 domain-containing protein [Rhizobium sp. NFR07]SFB38773.1 Uncharacterized conserved protein YjiS, DUF1127 family [Rhizobium sp. NFR07]